MKSGLTSLGTWWLAGACLLGTSALFVACSGAADPTDNDGSSTSDDGSGASGSSLSGSGGVGFGGGATASGGSGTGGGCAGDDFTAEKIQLDMFIMLDQSGSMDDSVGNQTKWQAVTGAIGAFVQDPQATGIGVGIQYFALPSGGMMCPAMCMTDADCGACGPCFAIMGMGFCLGASGGDSCNAVDYAKAEVPIAPLPGNAPLIVSSMGMHSPSTGTPTSASMQGGIDFSKQWQIDNPSHVVVHVYATDGDPSECDTNLANINAIAAAGFNGMPSIRTFVIGVGGSVAALHGYAAAGGTGMAFIIDQNNNAQQQFIDALKAIQGVVIPCAFAVPVPRGGEMIDYAQVNVEYWPMGDKSKTQTFKKVNGPTDCGAGDGWYYDNNAAPTQIILCDATCQKVSMDATGKVNIVVGCQSIID